VCDDSFLSNYDTVCCKCWFCCQVLFVDLDAKRLQSMVGDEGRIIPRKIQKALIAALTDDTGLFMTLSFSYVAASLLLSVDLLHGKHLYDVAVCCFVIFPAYKLNY